MSGVPLETFWAFNERWNNKFYYKVASFLFLLSLLSLCTFCTVTKLWTGDQWFRFKQTQVPSIFSKTSIPALSPIQTPIQRAPTLFFLWLKLLVRNSELWLPWIAEIKNEWNYTFNPPYDFMACNKKIYILAFLFFPEYPSLFSLPGFFLWHFYSLFLFRSFSLKKSCIFFLIFDLISFLISKTSTSCRACFRRNNMQKHKDLRK
jgi:hypothetical protein